MYEKKPSSYNKILETREIIFESELSEFMFIS